MSLELGGKNYAVPGVYALTKVINLGGTGLPTFNVGLIIGKQQKGTPYTAGIGSTRLLGSEIIRGYSNIADLVADYGAEGDSELTTFFRYAKKAGAGTIFVLGVNPTTQWSGKIKNNEGTPVDAIDLVSRDYGAHVNDISLTIASSIHTIIPPRFTTFLTADSGTGKTISVKNVAPFKVGNDVLLTDNAYSAPVSKTIAAIDGINKTITFTEAISASALVANYARIFQEDTENQEVSAALTTPAEVLAFYTESKYLQATIESGILVMPTTLAKTYLQNVTGATKATSPEAQASDWQNIADNFQQWNEEFALVNKVYLRIIGLVTSDAANHAAFRDMAFDLRTANKPVQIVSGCALGDIAKTSSDSDYPVKRAAALNSDEIQLAAVGLDGLGGYISLAGELFGIRLANEVIHNQTNDDVVATTVERSYFTLDPALEVLVKAGVVVPVMTKSGWKVSQGLTTYQDQTTTFNPSTKKTYLVTLRDLADFDLRTMLEILEAQVGADAVTREVISGIVVQASEKLRNDYHYIEDYRIRRIFKEGNAWVVDREVKLSPPTDFIGLISTIVVE
jgi:hypothetical protein